MIAIKIKNYLFFVVAGLMFFSLSYMIAAEDEKPLCFLLAEENRKIDLQKTQSQPDTSSAVVLENGTSIYTYEVSQSQKPSSFKEKANENLIRLNYICEELSKRSNSKRASQKLMFLTWRALIKKDRRAINDLFYLLKMNEKVSIRLLGITALSDRSFDPRVVPAAGITGLAAGYFLGRKNPNAGEYIGATIIAGVLSTLAYYEYQSSQEKKEFQAFTKKESYPEELLEEFKLFSRNMVLIESYINPRMKEFLESNDNDKGDRRSLRWILEDLDKRGKMFVAVLTSKLKSKSVCHDGLEKSYAFWGTSDFDYKEYQQAKYQHALINWLSRLPEKEDKLVAKIRTLINAR